MITIFFESISKQFPCEFPSTSHQLISINVLRTTINIIIYCMTLLLHWSCLSLFWCFLDQLELNCVDLVSKFQSYVLIILRIIFSFYLSKIAVCGLFKNYFVAYFQFILRIKGVCMMEVNIKKKNDFKLKAKCTYKHRLL